MTKEVVKETTAFKEFNEFFTEWQKKHFGKEKGVHIEMIMSMIAYNDNFDVIDSSISFSAHMDLERISTHADVLFDYAKQIEDGKINARDFVE